MDRIKLLDLVVEHLHLDGITVALHEDGFLQIAEAIEAAEREACAAEVERMTMYPGGRCEAPAHDNVWAAAKAIRERSNC